MDDAALPGDWKRMLNAYTEQRHKIVHRGDKKSVTRDQAQQCTDLIQKIGTVINKTAVQLYH